MKGRGTVFGAVSIVNAIAGGKGVTASVKLETEAIAEVENRPGEWKVLVNERESDPRLAVETARLIFKGAGKDVKEYSGTIRTKSDVPMGVGLKTSSSSSSAIALAISAALGQKAFDPQKVMNVSVEASLATGASVTGAMDDAASCLLGGMNLVDNLGRRVERSELFKKSMKVIIKVPDAKSRRPVTDVKYMKSFGKLTQVLYRMCLDGDTWRAMTLNGVLYSGILGYDSRAALDAIGLGALGASLSGTGPATAAVFEPQMLNEMKAVREAWSADGSRVIETETNNEHGRIFSLD